MHRGNVIELIGYALSRLRAGKNPGQVKREIQAAGAGWSAVEINRALAAAIIQLQEEKVQASHLQGLQIEPPLVSAQEIEVNEIANVEPEVLNSAGEKAVNVDQKLAEITAHNEIHPGQTFNTANWGILAALVLALLMVAVVIILVLKL